VPCFARGRRSDIVRRGVPADVASLVGAHEVAYPPRSGPHAPHDVCLPTRMKFVGAASGVRSSTEVVDTTTAAVEASTSGGLHWRLGRTMPIPVVIANDRPQARN
jgi:hypothetical protein